MADIAIASQAMLKAQVVGRNISRMVGSLRRGGLVLGGQMRTQDSSNQRRNLPENHGGRRSAERSFGLIPSAMVPATWNTIVPLR
jgi:hypothetical protein